MANLDDLDFKSISEMGTDEAIDLLRQIRLSRRTPTKSKVSKTREKAKAKVAVSADQAAELIKLLTGED
jgi:hypothetical protein